MAVGISGASGGLSIPLIRPTRSCPPASVAPVEPQETKASQAPSLTSFIPRTIEESFLVRIAATGGSAISITSVVGQIVIRPSGTVYFPSCALTSCSSPRSVISIRSSARTASTAPLTISSGALSPPMASTATEILSLIGEPPYAFPSKRQTSTRI